MIKEEKKEGSIKTQIESKPTGMCEGGGGGVGVMDLHLPRQQR